ncbi:MAG: radical SAM protein [Treponema sp.]|nr:radical SAM protein [Treponema sp.]
MSNINLYLSWACNHKCVHCWVEGSPDNVEHLEADICIDLLSKALPLGLRRIKITGGEPFVFMNSVETILDWCHEHEVSAAMESNGTLLTEAFINRYLLNKQVNLSVSLNGYDAKSHDDFVNYKGSFDKVISSLNMLRKKGVAIEIITSIYKENIYGLEETIKLCVKYNPSMIKINPIISIGRGDVLLQEHKILDFVDIKALSVKVDEYAECYKTKIFLHVPPAVRSFNALKCFGAGTCSYLNMLSLLPDKSLALCGYGGVNREMVWGTYNKEFELKTFWENNTAINAMRNAKHIDGVCGQCIHQKVCRGECKAIAVNHFNRWDAPSPFCQELFDRGNFPRTRLLKA